MVEIPRHESTNSGEIKTSGTLKLNIKRIKEKIITATQTTRTTNPALNKTSFKFLKEHFRTNIS